jgi:hypothetical protein
MNGYLDELFRGYVEAALWSSNDGDDRSFQQRGFTPDDLAPATRLEMRRDCTRFLSKARALLVEKDISPGDAGHNFWLTSQGEGTGFWDRGYGEVGDQLTKIAQSEWGEYPLYLGDDGKIHS